VRVRGGHTKFRALRLEQGNFSWSSESIAKKTRVLDVVYNATNNELVRTKTLVKNAIVQVLILLLHLYHIRVRILLYIKCPRNSIPLASLYSY
jgi:ribosomal protein S8E